MSIDIWLVVVLVSVTAFFMLLGLLTWSWTENTRLHTKAAPLLAYAIAYAGIVEAVWEGECTCERAIGPGVTGAIIMSLCAGWGVLAFFKAPKQYRSVMAFYTIACILPAIFFTLIAAGTIG